MACLSSISACRHVLVGGKNRHRGGMARTELAAIADCDRQLGVLHLRGGFSTQLPRGFQQQENAALARVIRRQAAAVGIQRRLAWVVEDEMAIADECPPSPFLQKPRSSMRHMTVMENES